VFSLTTTLDGSYWRLGVGVETDGDEIVIRLPPELLETYYGNNAASRIRRAETTLALTSRNPAIVSPDEVYFGLMFQNEEGSRTAGIYVQEAQPNVLNLAQRSDEAISFLSQRPVNVLVVRLRLERDPVTGAISIFFNDSQIGAALAFLEADAPLVPALFVKDGGVIVSVTGWRISLR
jgi:hypothetical protein